MSGHLPALVSSRAADARVGQPSLPGAAFRGSWLAQAAPAAPTAAEPAAAAVAEAQTADAARQAVSRAVERYAPGRDVSVDNRYDQATGRAVVRVADRRTGEVLFESPPEELLRFFASARERPGAPLVVLEA